ncbi:hypothetical protein [Psychrobacillus sp. NPDC096389]|uniref:hypothetical protein n=1 Tax=Psychrobacillus sp. NPDC096389 TaxID=3364490 RepID=UPI00382B35C3
MFNESPYVKSFAPRFLKSKGTYDFWAVMFELQVDFTSNELQMMFDKHNQGLIDKGEHPEFEKCKMQRGLSSSLHVFC